MKVEGRALGRRFQGRKVESREVPRMVGYALSI